MPGCENPSVRPNPFSAQQVINKVMMSRHSSVRAIRTIAPVAMLLLTVTAGTAQEVRLQIPVSAVEVPAGDEQGAKQPTPAQGPADLVIDPFVLQLQERT